MLYSTGSRAKDCSLFYVSISDEEKKSFMILTPGDKYVLIKDSESSVLEKEILR